MPGFAFLPESFMAKWARKYIDALPDSAFLYVEPDGTKDEGGKTVPRSKRHFPVRNAKGKLDKAHIDAALSRIPDSDIPDEEKTRCTAEAHKLLKEVNKTSKSCTFSIPIFELDAAEGEAPKEAPSEFRIFRKGINETTKGPILFDDKAASDLMAVYTKQNRRVVIDLNHEAVQDPPVDDDAYGWLKCALRDGELWAENIQWLPAGAEKVTTGKKGFFSPTIFYELVEFEGRLCMRPFMLLTVSLTNIPAMYDIDALGPIEPLSLAIDDRSESFASSMSFDDVAAIVYRALCAKFEDDNGCVWMECIYDDRAIFRKRERLYQVPYRLEGSSAVFTGDAFEVRRSYEPVPGGITMKSVLAALGLAPTATESETLSALQKLQGFQAEIFGIAGKTNPAEAIGALRGMKESSAQTETLNARLEQVEKNARKVELDALIEKASTPDKDNRVKLAPGQKEWAVEYGMKDLAGFKAYLEKAPPVLKLGSVPAPAPDGTGTPVGAMKWEKLSNMEKHNLYESDRATYDALKADYERREQAGLIQK